MKLNIILKAFDRGKRSLKKNEMNNYEEFRVYGKEMVDYICEYVKAVDQKPVASSVKPGFMVPLFTPEMPQNSESYSDVLKDLEEKIMPGMLHWTHSNFFGYYGGGNAYPSLLGEMLGAAMGSVGFSWESCPPITELECIMLDWYAKALDLPDFFLSKASNQKSLGCGTIQNTASDATFACMMAARARAIKQLKGDKKTHESCYLPKLVCYTSTEAHSSVEKAAMMSLVKIRFIGTNSDDSMRVDTLEQTIEADVANGLCPFFVSATLGTTSQCAFDNLEDIGSVCKKYPSIWLHADGAYGGNAFLVPEMRYLKKGMELIDSFVTNPYKMLLTSLDCSCMWVKNVQTFKSAFAINPVYLQTRYDDTSFEDLRHFGVPLSRPFRSLKLYFMFRMYGLDKLQALIRRSIAMGKYIEELVKADERFEVRNKVLLGLVAFKLKQCDEVNQELCNRLNSSGKIFLTPSRIKGELIIRFLAHKEDCNESQIQAAWNIIQNAATKLLKNLVN